MLMQSERMSPRFNYQAATGPLSLHQLPAGADAPSTDPVWLLYCAEPRGDAFLSSLLSNDHTESFLRTRRRCCVLLCGLLIQRGGSRQPPLRLPAASARTVPVVPTRTVNQTPGCWHAQTGWRLISAQREGEGHTDSSSKLQLLFLRSKYSVSSTSEYTNIQSNQTDRRSVCNSPLWQ